MQHVCVKYIYVYIYICVCVSSLCMYIVHIYIYTLSRDFLPALWIQPFFLRKYDWGTMTGGDWSLLEGRCLDP